MTPVFVPAFRTEWRLPGPWPVLRHAEIAIQLDLTDRDAVFAYAAPADASRRARFDEVPSVAMPVGEHGHRALRLLPRLLLELDTPAHVVPVVAPEVVRCQEEEHASARLVPDRGALALANRLGNTPKNR